MPLRFKLLSTLFALMMLAATDSNQRLFDSSLDIFAGLAVFMLMAIASVVPNDNRVDRVDRALDGSSWADRIDVEALARQRGGTGGSPQA